MDRVANAVSLLKDRVNPDLPVIVGRDRAFLADVANQLGLDGMDPLQQAQVAALLGVMEVATAQEYPKHIYPNGVDQPFIVVNDADEEAAAMALSGEVRIEKSPFKNEDAGTANKPESVGDFSGSSDAAPGNELL